MPILIPILFVYIYLLDIYTYTYFKPIPILYRYGLLFEASGCH